MILKHDAIKHLEAVLPQSKFDIGGFLSEGLSLWKKEAGPFIGFGFIFIFMSMMIGLIPILGSIANQLLITPALTAGAYIFSHRIYKKDSNPDFGQFFDGFKLASDIVIAQLIYMLAMIVTAAPFLVLMWSNFGEINTADPTEVSEIIRSVFLSPTILLLIIPMVVAFLFSYTIHFVVFYRLPGVDAVKYSFKFVWKHFFPLLVLIIITSILMMLGLIAVIIGVFITMTFLFPISYASFKGVTQLDAFENQDESLKVHDALIT